MRKLLASMLSVAAVFVFAVTAQAASVTLNPWTYDPDNTGTVVSEVDSNGDLRLEKNAPTPTNSSAGATLEGVEGLSTTGMTLSFNVDGYCEAGAPRFNVTLESGSTIFLGCVYGDEDADGTVVFEAGETYGGVLFPEGETVTRINIVQDEEGQTTLSNIAVNGVEVVVPLPVTVPTNKDQCKNGGWMTFSNPSFKNQGQCVSYVQANPNSGKQR